MTKRSPGELYVEVLTDTIEIMIDTYREHGFKLVLGLRNQGEILEKAGRDDLLDVVMEYHLFRTGTADDFLTDVLRFRAKDFCEEWGTVDRAKLLHSDIIGPEESTTAFRADLEKIVFTQKVVDVKGRERKAENRRKKIEAQFRFVEKQFSKTEFRASRLTLPEENSLVGDLPITVRVEYEVADRNTDERFDGSIYLDLLKEDKDGDGFGRKLTTEMFSLCKKQAVSSFFGDD